MLDILKNALIDRNFYTQNYKKISKKSFVAYILLVSLLGSLIISPLVTSISLKYFIQIKKQISKVPPGIEISLSKKGLSSSVKEPLVFNLELNNSSKVFYVIDPNNKYKPNKNNVIVVFRKKGIIVYTKKKISYQSEYKIRTGTFKITFGDLQKFLNNIPLFKVAITAFLFFLIIFMIALLTRWVLISLVVGLGYFILNKVLFKKPLTLLQAIKKIAFLATYYIIGGTLQIIQTSLTGQLIRLNLGFLFFIGAFFFLNVLPPIKNNNKN